MTFARARTARTLDGVEYAPGRKFRVVRAGLTLNGMTPVEGGGMRGWQQVLQPGDLLTCTGFGAGWGSDPGYGIEFTTGQSERDRASHCDVYPSAGGIFNYRPPAGYLEPADEEETPAEYLGTDELMRLGENGLDALDEEENG